MIEVVCNAVGEFWTVLGLMAPYLLFGFLMAGLLSVLISPEIVERHLGGSGFLPVAKASLFGVPLPLCSCSVIPVAASLRRHGASRGATTSFLLSTPQTGVDSIIVTYGLLGPVIAVFRPFAAFLTGVIGGLLATWADGDGGGREESAEPCTEACCSGDPGRGRIARILSYGFVTLPRDIGKDLLVGLAIAGAISAFVPAELLTNVGSGLGAMLAMMLLGIPLYVCASASVPVAAALIAKGISPGAALVFLMTGPATNAAAITTVRRVMGWRTVLIYLGTVAFTALGWGLLLDRIFALEFIPRVPQIHEMAPGWFGNLGAVVLLAVLGLAVVRRPRPAPVAEVGENGGSLALHIHGMTCEHCAEAVRRALLDSPGIASAEVNLKTGMATVAGDALDLASLRHVVQELGYEVEACSDGG